MNDEQPYLVWRLSPSGVVEAGPAVVLGVSPEAVVAQFYGYAVVVPAWIEPDLAVTLYGDPSREQQQ
jgi:hypothetical protein